MAIPTIRLKTRRRMLGTGAALVPSLALACGTSGTSTTAPAEGQAGRPSGAKDKGPITIQQWDSPQSPFGQWLLSYYQEFPAKTGIQIEILQRKADVAAAQEQAVWAASGDVPDVFFRTGRGGLLYAAFASKNVIQSLSPFIKRDKFDLADFWPNVIKLMTAKGQQWVMPQDFNQGLFAYNVPILQSAGVKAPPHDWKDTSWTWNEFVERSRRVQQQLTQQGGGAERFAYSRPSENWQMWLWTNGGDILSSDWKKITIDEPRAIDALDFASKLTHSHRIAPAPAHKFPPGQPLATQTVAMASTWAATLNPIRGQNKDLAFDTSLFPRGQAGYVAFGGGGGYVMSATTKHPDAAWEMLKYIGAPAYAEHKVKAGALGPRISTAKKFFVQPGLPPEHGAVYFDAPAHAKWEPNLTNWTDIQSEINKALGPLWSGEQTPKEAVANARRAIESLLPQGEPFL